MTTCTDTFRLPFLNVPIIQQKDDYVPLSLIQISPILKTSETYVEQLSSPTIKLHLQQIIKGSNGQLQILWDDESSSRSPENVENAKEDAVMRISSGTIYLSEGSSSSCEIINNAQSEIDKCQIVPFVMMPSSNPLNVDGVPCMIRAYSIPYCQRLEETATSIASSSSIRTSHRGNYISDRCFISNGTLVQIAPPVVSNWIDGKEHVCQLLANQRRLDGETLGFQPVQVSSLCNDLSGISNLHHEFNEKEVLLCYDKDTVRALTVRMKMLMESQVMVGTTYDAIDQWNEGRRRHDRMLNALDAITTHTSDGRHAEEKKDEDANEFLRDGALTVHDPLNCSGKTTLVATIAVQELKCQAVHIVNATTLFAQYGASGADATLESLLHGIIVSAAAKGMAAGGIGSVCIILDHLETFVPPSMSGARNDGDPAIPALNAIRAYLTKLVASIRDNKAFPFPTKNPLYNVGGEAGFILPVKLCLVGVVTCDDDGGRKASGIGYNAGTVLDTLGENRYRMQTPSSQSGHDICMQLFDHYNIELSPDAGEELPFLVSSIHDAKAMLFLAVARKLVRILDPYNKSKDKKSVATLQHLKLAFGASTSAGIVVAVPTIKQKPSSTSLFSPIGGNHEAKKALVDALAFDKRKRRVLERFGLSPPMGVMLFGPPGTGKTLLAKATALMMQRNPSEDSVSASVRGGGGYFISLSASDIVRSEVGKSEKLVSSAFKTARENAPSVIFIDEFQALFTSRDGTLGGGGKGSSRLASTLLQCMDDIVKWREADSSVLNRNRKTEFENNRVVVLGATNTPWMIDRAFLRAGRFDRVVHVGLPDESERDSIFQVYVERMKLHSNTSVQEVCLTLVPLTNGFSGADIAALVRSAAVRCLNDERPGDVLGVELRHFLEAKKFDVAKPSCNSALVAKLKKWRP